MCGNASTKKVASIGGRVPLALKTAETLPMIRRCVLDESRKEQAKNIRRELNKFSILTMTRKCEMALIYEQTLKALLGVVMEGVRTGSLWVFAYVRRRLVPREYCSN